MFVVLKQNISKNALGNENLLIFVSSYRQSCRPFHRFFEIIRLATEAACTTTGLFLFHKSSLGQSHTKGAVTSRRTDSKGELLRVSGLLDETLSGASHTNRLLGSVTVGSVSQEVFTF